jgi:hypothetical protein
MTWKDEYVKAMTAFMLRHGEVMGTYVRDEHSESMRDHVNDVKIRKHLSHDNATVHEMKESRWEQGGDTFTEGTDMNGIDLIVSCDCGEVDHRRIRYEGSVGEILIGIFMEEMDTTTCKGCTGTCCTGVGSDPCTC